MVYLVLSLDFVLHSGEVFSSSCLHICGPEESVADYRQLQTVAPEWGPDRVDWSLDLVSFIGVESWSDPSPRTNLPWEDPAGQEALSISGGHNAAKILSK